ncbi:hypothetical protein CRE_24661 [Caenorhabditis remanei]|uniref:Uncharacterized protein n=1 Tax=Caenorhabditis remanei TaxID=31234 RepID=E3N3Y4_CAERE|nr:hypothetical protein CRE_24661 [Caenorhabditis remanei]
MHLGSSVNYALAQSTPSNTTPDPKDKERQGCLKDENQNRRGYAKMNKIGNMVKLEYDKSMELNPIEGFECPNQLQAQKYKEGVWAFSKTGDGTSDSPLASKFACVQHEKCGFLLLINKGPKHADQARGKEAGTACSGKVDDGLCIGSAASFGFFFLISFISFFNL